MLPWDIKGCLDDKLVDTSFIKGQALYNNSKSCCFIKSEYLPVLNKSVNANVTDIFQKPYTLMMYYFLHVIHIFPLSYAFF